MGKRINELMKFMGQCVGNVFVIAGGDGTDARYYGPYEVGALGYVWKSGETDPAAGRDIIDAFFSNEWTTTGRPARSEWEYGQPYYYITAKGTVKNDVFIDDISDRILEYGGNMYPTPQAAKEARAAMFWNMYAGDKMTFRDLAKMDFLAGLIGVPLHQRFYIDYPDGRTDGPFMITPSEFIRVKAGDRGEVLGGPAPDVLTELFFDDNIKPRAGMFAPQARETYYFVTATGEIKEKINSGSTFDLAMACARNRYRTREDAKTARDGVLTRFKKAAAGEEWGKPSE